MKKYSKGFTLIELLVVIAIIGILSSVVLASLNTARNKGKDASAKSSISSIRAAMEIYYNGTGDNTYGDAGADTGGCADGEITRLLDASDAQTTADAVCVVGVNGDSYVAHTTLSDTTIFCVDSTGYAGEATTPVVTPATDVACS